jgi:hypothetical protein
MAAKAGARERYKPNTELYKGFPRYTILKKNRPKQGSTGKYLKEEWQGKIEKERKEMSKGTKANWSQFDLKRSNKHMKEDGEEDWFGKTLRLRNLGLYLPDRVSTATKAGSKKERKTYSLNNEIFYPTILCEQCEEEEGCDLFHLHTCTGMKELNQNHEGEFKRICEEITGIELEPYFWCEKTKTLAEGGTKKTKLVSQPSSVYAKQDYTESICAVTTVSKCSTPHVSGSQKLNKRWKARGPHFNVENADQTENTSIKKEKKERKRRERKEEGERKKRLVRKY